MALTGGRRLATGVILLAAAAVLASGGCAAPAVTDLPDDLGAGEVVRVIDGDTVDVDIAGRVERVRLIGVDTPETVHRNVPVECYGPEASAFTKALLPAGTAVRLERDRVLRDRYGRLLAYVFRDADGMLVNLALVEHGMADAVSYGDNEALWTVLRATEARARAEPLGLWAECGGPDVVAEAGG